MTTQDLINGSELSRLEMSLSVLLPRLDRVAHEFCQLVEHAAPTLRLMLPSDERLIASGIKQILVSVRAPGSAEQLGSSFAQLGGEAGIDDSQLPVLLGSLQTAMAEMAGYTWTSTLESGWTDWLDTLVECAMIERGGAGTQAA